MKVNELYNIFKKDLNVIHPIYDIDSYEEDSDVFRQVGYVAISRMNMHEILTTMANTQPGKLNNLPIFDNIVGYLLNATVKLMKKNDKFKDDSSPEDVFAFFKISDIRITDSFERGEGYGSAGLQAAIKYIIDICASAEVTPIILADVSCLRTEFPNEPVNSVIQACVADLVKFFKRNGFRSFNDLVQNQYSEPMIWYPSSDEDKEKMPDFDWFRQILEKEQDIYDDPNQSVGCQATVIK